MVLYEPQYGLQGLSTINSDQCQWKIFSEKTAQIHCRNALLDI